MKWHDRILLRIQLVVAFLGIAAAPAFALFTATGPRSATFTYSFGGDNASITGTGNSARSP